MSATPLATSAQNWFFTAPQPKPYLIAERLRNSLWEMRLGSLWLETERAEAPFAVAGTFNGGAVRIEWAPAQWLRLTAQPEAAALVDSLGVLLRRKPTLAFGDATGQRVVEWWLAAEAAARRWQELQGKPAYSNPQRLDQ